MKMPPLSNVFPDKKTFYVIAYFTGHEDKSIELLDIAFNKKEDALDYIERHANDYLESKLVLLEAKLSKLVGVGTYGFSFTEG